MLADIHAICNQMRKISSYNVIGLQLQIHGKWKINLGRKLGVGGMVKFEIGPRFIFGFKIACKQK